MRIIRRIFKNKKYSCLGPTQSNVTQRVVREREPGVRLGDCISGMGMVVPPIGDWAVLGPQVSWG